MKILIIDDSVLDRKLLAKIFEKAEIGQDIVQASNGQEGLDILKQEYDEISLILLDWQMPVMDGIQFMQEVRQRENLVKVPIIMITASGSEDCKRKAREVNPDLAAYIVKPYKSQDLIDAVKTFIQ